MAGGTGGGCTENPGRVPSNETPKYTEVPRAAIQFPKFAVDEIVRGAGCRSFFFALFFAFSKFPFIIWVVTIDLCKGGDGLVLLRSQIREMRGGPFISADRTAFC